MLLTGAFQRTVILTRKKQPYQHALTRIDFFGHDTSKPSQLGLIYPTIRFIAEHISTKRVISRLSRLKRMRFIANRTSLKFENNSSFQNHYYPSNNSFSKWPGMFFDITLGSTAYLSGDTLIHADPKLPTYGTEYAAVREFLDFPGFSSSDGRIGHILIFVPNLNGRIEKLTINETELQIELKTVVPLSDLTLDVEYGNRTETQKYGATLQSAKTTVPLDFLPTTINVWLKSRHDYILDYHREDQYGSVGANPVLPKLESPTAWANIPTVAMGGFTPVDSIDISTPAEISVPNSYHTFMPAGSQHDAYVEIRRIVQQATGEILIVDSWVDDSLWPLLSNIPANCRIRVLTQNMKNDFRLEAKKFASQHKNTISVRQTTNYHDRFIVLDGKRCFHLGASIKDAGSKAFVFSEISSPKITASAIADVEAEWGKSTVITI